MADLRCCDLLGIWELYVGFGVFGVWFCGPLCGVVVLGWVLRPSAIQRWCGGVISWPSAILLIQVPAFSLFEAPECPP